ncbi:EpsD family peptidyl-prolyl cis-trans isomerase [Schlegelella sp. S2-27]|uniref:EpsD family peptidyl-prolyl cis-trans isomerase n=1 Tax=Caldimonas mangrovi TaxID=2944811 RepID=A0ABT0YST3_9BURK|nr:EpsD family peptidyl-prolyl cis-trans isomerase [Caldimonas mangrovi]MCM5681347.1 EpsD family peptidyl-prolyl cis-trans isomerase [Caldimonas mangrovi]
MNTIHHSNAMATMRSLAVASAVIAALFVAGCGDKKDKPASQVAAKVNKGEISVHQINYVLQRQPGLKQEQAEVASKEALQKLIDQELAVQRATEMKLDRDPRAVQAIEAARREILARFYLEKVAEAASKPSPEEVKAYYDAKPALFSQRRVYNLQEVAIQADQAKLPEIEQHLKSAKSTSDFLEYLRANSIQFAVNQAARAAEQLPLNMLDAFHELKDGQAMMVPSPSGAQAIFLVASREAPVDEVRARPAIEQFILNDRKRKMVEEDLKALRAGAEIEYVGKFADGAPTAAQAAAKDQPATAQQQGTSVAADDDAAAISKGLSGIK